MATQQEVIKNFMATLDNSTLKGSEAIDAAIRASSSFQSTQAVIDKMISDCNNANSGDEFLKTYCGIDLSNSDTGAITGSDAGGSKSKTAESIVPESGDLDTSFSRDEFTVRGLTFKIGDNKTFKDLTEDQKYIIRGMKTWWAESAIKLIEDSYNLRFTDDDTFLNEISIEFYYDSSQNAMVATTNWHDGYEYGPYDGKIDKMEMRINMAAYYNFSNSDQNGISPTGQSYLDRTIAHELTHAIMNARMVYRYEFPNFITEGMAELTHGIDDERGTRISNLAQDATLLKSSLNISKTTNASTNEYAAGYMFLRYFAKQAANSTVADSINTIDNRSSNVSVIGGSGIDSVYNAGSNVTISVGAGDDTVRNFGPNAAVYGGADNDSLYNDDKAVRSTINASDGNNYVSNFGSYTKIISGSGKDSVYNDDDCTSVTVTSGAGNDSVRNLSNSSAIDLGAGNDSVSNSGASVTITGGTGDDYIFNTGSNLLINYTSGDGNDKIVGFNATSTLSISGSSYSSAKSENDLILTVGTNKITLSGAATLPSVNILGSKAGNNLITLTENADLHYNSKANVTINALGGDDSIYNYSVASGVSINAGAGADRVVNFADKVTMIGGAGNDTIRNVTTGYPDGKNYTVNADIADSVLIDGGTGNDSIWNAGDAVSINGGDGSDTIENNGELVTITGGAGNDSIRTLNSNTSINGGEGDDTVANVYTASNITLNGGTGNDSIGHFGGGPATIIGGYGSDTISWTSRSAAWIPRRAQRSWNSSWKTVPRVRPC